MPKIIVRKIVPPKFKDDVFIKEYRRAIQKVGKTARGDFQAVTKGWKNKVNWHYRTRERKGFISFLINTDDNKASDILKFWNYGVKKHVIRPRKAGGRLAFHWPKGVALGISAPMTKDGKFLFEHVNHPGQKGHHILEEIIIHTNILLLDEAIKANARATRASGHAI